MICGRCGKEGDGAFCQNCGAPLAAEAQAGGQPPAVPPAAVPAEALPRESRFTGGAFANFFIGLLTALVSVLTLSLAYPAMQCWHIRWKVKHTYYDGRRLAFDGKAGQLFGKYIIWVLLSVVTLGIYALLAMPVNLARWRAEHTHILGEEGKVSRFTGSVWGLFGVNFVCGFVTLITLSFGMYWAHCYKERWFARHTEIDGAGMRFEGTGLQYFGKCICWVLLTVITLGIYSFWLLVKIEKWTVRHTHIEEPDRFPTPEQQAAFLAANPEPPVYRSSVLTSVGFGLALFYLIVSYIPLPINIAIASEFMLSVFTGIPAIVLSAVGLSGFKKDGNPNKAFFVLGILGVVLSAFFLLLSLMSLFIHF